MAGSVGEAGCVPPGRKALTGPLDCPVNSSSPYIDFIPAARASKGPNGLIFAGPMVIWEIWMTIRPGCAPRVPPLSTAGYNGRY